MFGKGIGAPEIILILVVLILLFGAKRLPDAARSLGRSMRIFKSEVKEMHGDDDTPAPREQPREVEGRIVDSPRTTDASQRVPTTEQADRDR
ncbi:MAG: Sec-independent protein translocase subunit TatA [Actinomycetes bacterium]